MVDKKSQRQWVLDQLARGATLSSRDAVLNYGIQDLPKRISELKRKGYPIESLRVNKDRTHWNEYRMVL